MIRLIAVFLFVTVQFSSCMGKTTSKDVSTPEIEEQPITEHIKIQRFDSLLFLNLNNPSVHDHLYSTYPDLLSAVGSVTINQPEIDDKTFFPKLSSYFKNDMLYRIYNDALNVFKNTSTYEAELSIANEQIKNKFNGRSLPLVAMHISGFKANTIVTERYISISIDKYLGQNYRAYQNFFEAYQRSQMQPKFVTRDILKAWIMTEIPAITSPAKTLLEEIIYEGKILYALSELLPEWNKEDLIGYTSDQYNWCVDNQNSIWKSIIEKKHLYNNEYFLNQKYLVDAPFTSTISTKSPGRVGAWVGWQIVAQYAQNTGKGISDILKLNDAQLILKDSKYNPIVK